MTPISDVIVGIIIPFIVVAIIIGFVVFIIAAAKSNCWMHRRI